MFESKGHLELDTEGGIVSFADIHCHALCGVDDGARDEERMHSMIDAEYGEGVRYLCVTPHYHPGYYGRNEEQTEKSLAIALAYANRYPDLHIIPGNELHYASECLDWLRQGMCRGVGNSRYVLVDFRERARESLIVDAMSRICNGGYTPILAHAERYKNLKLMTAKVLKQDGILIQVNSGSILGNFGWSARTRARRLLSHRLVDFLSTDAHNLSNRAPQFLRAYEWIQKKYGTDYATYICREHAVKLFFCET